MFEHVIEFEEEEGRSEEDAERIAPASVNMHRSGYRMPKEKMDED